MADDDTPKKKGKGKLLLFLLLFLLLAGGGGAGAWFFFLKDKFAPADGASAGPEKKVVESAPGTPPPGTTVALQPPFMVNLADPLGRRFIKLSVDVEVADPAVALEVDKQKPRIRDSIILLLSSKSYADLATVESKHMLKNEITDRMNDILGTGKVYQVFITEMVIQ